MLRSYVLRITVGILSALAVGCATDDKDHNEHDQAKPKAEDHSTHDHGDHHDDKAAGEESFAGLSDADAKLAKAQGTCPVTGEELGGMGTPIKVMVGDTPVFLCCEGCRKKLLRDPDKYLAKLGK